MQGNTDPMKPSSPTTQSTNEQKLNTCTVSARSVFGAEGVEQTRRQMQAAMERNVCVLTGKLQKMLARSKALCKRMQQAAQQNDFTLMDHLRAQLNALAECSRHLDACRTQMLEKLGLRLQENHELSKAAMSTMAASAAEENTDSTKASPLTMQQGNRQELNTYTVPAVSVFGAEVVQQTRQQMQDAAFGAEVVKQTWRQMQDAVERGDYILAGKLQETLTRLITLCTRMQQAAQQDDFILIGHLQAQLNTLADSFAQDMATTTMPNSRKLAHSESRIFWT